MGACPAWAAEPEPEPEPELGQLRSSAGGHCHDALEYLAAVISITGSVTGSGSMFP
jgi:hypothetical protein